MRTLSTSAVAAALILEQGGPIYGKTLAVWITQSGLTALGSRTCYPSRSLEAILSQAVIDGRKVFTRSNDGEYDLCDSEKARREPEIQIALLKLAPTA